MGFEEIIRSVGFTATRFLAFTSHAFLFGSPVVLLLVLRPAFAPLPDEGWAPGRSRLGLRLESIMQAAMIGSLVATIVAIALQATLIASLTNGDLTRPTFLSVFGTTFGQWHLFRLPLLAGLAVLLGGTVGRWSLARPGPGGPGRAWWTGWLGLSWMLLATSSFTGHAAVSSPKAVGLTNDVVHLAAGAIWFTGVVLLAVFVPDAWRGKAERDRLALLTPVVVRFSVVALTTITIVAVTGAINSFLNVGRLEDLVTSGYGVSLTLKIALFVGILAMGAINHFILRDRLRKGMDDPTRSTAHRTFRKTIAVELALALSIMGVTGWLVGQAKTRVSFGNDAPSVSSGRP